MKAASSQNMRIAKYIARCGLCSRREAETWISMGRVSVNGEKIDTPAINVSPRCIVRVDDKKLSIEAPRLFLHYKRPHVLTTHLADPKKRATLAEVLHTVPDLPAFLMPVGRLDFMSEGLILLSNDGDLTRYFELPSSKFVRVYEVIVKGPIDEEALRQLYAPEGIVVDGWRYEPMKVEVKKKSFDACVLRVSITEGKNREIRRVFASIGLKIRKLIRVAYGPYSLEDLLPGDIQEVPVSASLLERAKKSSSLVKSRTSKPKPKRLRRKPVENRLNSQESIKQRREMQNVE